MNKFGTQRGAPVNIRRGSVVRLVRGVAAAVCGLLLTGCANQDAPPEDLKPIDVGPVSLFGLTLDADAAPEQVTYALLQSLRDTAMAGRQHVRDKDQRRKLTEATLSLCAPQRIYSNIHGGPPAAGLPQRSRDEAVYRIVKLWAPMVARYVDSFTPDAATLTKAMRVRPHRESDIRLALDVTDPFDKTSVTLLVYLTQEAGADGRKYWRAYRLGYAPVGGEDTATTRRAATGPSGN